MSIFLKNRDNRGINILAKKICFPSPLYLNVVIEMNASQMLAKLHFNIENGGGEGGGWVKNMGIKGILPYFSCDLPIHGIPEYI